MKKDVPIREVRALLQDRIRDLLARLVPGGRFDGGTYVAKNPTRDDRKAGSFVIWTRGGAAGAWREHATGDKGDVIDLIAYLQGRPGDRKYALQWAKDFLGIAEMSAEDLAAVRDKVKAQAARARELESEQAARKRERAWKMWLNAPMKHVGGTLAGVYLASRKIPVAEISNPERGELRFNPMFEHWKSAVWKVRDGRRVKESPGPMLPAMIAAIRDANGVCTAVHCTFLAEDGGGKAAVPNPKLMLGTVQGSVIRISRGPSNMTPEEAAAHGVVDTLVIAEGIEDALSIALHLPEARVWAATSLGNIANVPVWHPCVDRVVVAADNDWKTPQAIEQLEAAVEQLKSHGKPVSVMRAHAGKDFNDLL